MISSYAKLPSLVLACSIGLIGCGGGGGGGGDNETSDDADNNPVTTSTPVDGGVNTDDDTGTDPSGMLEGTWLSDCDFDENSLLTISGNVAVFTQQFFLQENCVELDTEFALDVDTLSLEFPAGSVTTNLGTAFFIDLTLESFTVDGELITPESGDDDFSTEFDIFLISNDGRLFFGDDNFDGALESPENRPAEIDDTRGFTRL